MIGRLPLLEGGDAYLELTRELAFVGGADAGAAGWVEAADDVANDGCEMAVCALAECVCGGREGLAVRFDLTWAMRVACGDCHAAQVSVQRFRGGANGLRGG